MEQNRNYNKAESQEREMTMSLLPRIESTLRKSRVSSSRFGLLVARDPNLVGDLRKGRRPGPRLRARLLAALQALEA